MLEFEEEQRQSLTLVRGRHVTKDANKLRSFNNIFEYDNNRFANKKWTIRIEDDKMIMFNSTLKHKITTNENNEDLILLSIQYQFING